MAPVVEPTLALETELLASAPLVIGLDEVGRGAIAGPVCVGACAMTLEQLAAGAPAGLRDSKLLSPKRREGLVEPVRTWVRAGAVGSSSVTEIETHGIAWALAHAAKRALAKLFEDGVDVASSLILLDGSHDWLSREISTPLRVIVRPKADRDCAIVAAASILAKVERDAHMVTLAGADDPYLWASNKGYASVAHTSALRERGPSEYHRVNWLSKILAADASDAPAGPVTRNPA